MIIRMSQERFDSLPVDAVGHACFEPMVPVYQGSMRGPGEEARERRAEFFRELTPGQRALFFFSYYDHAIRSEEEFRGISLRFASAGIFGIVKRGAEYFHDTDMLGLLTDVEKSFAENGQDAASELYGRLRELSPRTLALIGEYVKANPAEFVRLEP